MTERQDIWFRAADGTELSAWLYLPADAGPPRPAITMAHGSGATKEHGLDRYARAFADAGFVVLAHDHRTFGASGGQPRQDIDPWAQVDDWRRAINYLETRDAVDTARIGIWGTSYSGGHAIVLGATDRRIRAVVPRSRPPTDTPPGCAAFHRRRSPAWNEPSMRTSAPSSAANRRGRRSSPTLTRQRRRPTTPRTPSISSTSPSRPESGRTRSRSPRRGGPGCTNRAAGPAGSPLPGCS